MYLSMSCPNRGRAGIQGQLTSMSCPCLGQMSNYWHMGLPRVSPTDIFSQEGLGKRNVHTCRTGDERAAKWLGMKWWQKRYNIGFSSTSTKHTLLFFYLFYKLVTCSSLLFSYFIAKCTKFVCQTGAGVVQSQSCSVTDLKSISIYN